MRISDWSSDVCSSDLAIRRNDLFRARHDLRLATTARVGRAKRGGDDLHALDLVGTDDLDRRAVEQEFDTFLLGVGDFATRARSEEHTSELQSLMRNSYVVFCCKKKQRYIFKLIHLNTTN